MQLSHRVGLVLLLNLSIVSSGAMLSGVMATENSVVAQAQRSNELEAANDEGMRLFEAGSKTSLTAAIQQFERALQLSQAAAQRPQRGLALGFLGRIYLALGEPTKALEYFNQALPIWRGLSGKSGEAITLRNIGRVYVVLGEPTKALEYANQALLIFRATSDRSGEAITLNNMAAVYAALDEKTKALEYFSQALAIYRAVSDRSGEATTLNNLGRVYETLGEPTKALEYYNSIPFPSLLSIPPIAPLTIHSSPSTKLPIFHRPARSAFSAPPSPPNPVAPKPSPSSPTRSSAKTTPDSQAKRSKRIIISISANNPPVAELGVIWISIACLSPKLKQREFSPLFLTRRAPAPSDSMPPTTGSLIPKSANTDMSTSPPMDSLITTNPRFPALFCPALMRRGTIVKPSSASPTCSPSVRVTLLVVIEGQARTTQSGISSIYTLSAVRISLRIPTNSR